MAPPATATTAVGRRGPRPQSWPARRPRIRRRSGESAAARCGRRGHTDAPLPRPLRPARGRDGRCARR
ncbi:MAG: hypothetical protein E2593_11375 [Stenotrophomonas sp.]|nr:hypothetical protein [Stenotrophomonas sp.]